MISNRAAKYLWDVQQAAERICRFTDGRTLDHYFADEMLSAAVERQFEITGEALARLRRTAPEVAARGPEAAKIIGFRNVISHEYDGLDFEQVWEVIEDKLPRLREIVAELLKDVGPPC